MPPLLTAEGRLHLNDMKLTLKKSPSMPVSKTGLT